MMMVSSRSKNALMAIKLARRIGPSDFFNAFSSLPTTFMPSFLREQNKKLKNLPSWGFQPIYDSLQMRYKDIYPSLSAEGVPLPLLRNTPPDHGGVITLERAFGVPIPDPNVVVRENILKRQVKIGYFNVKTRQFVGNTCFVLATWKPQYEGIIILLFV